MRESYDSTLPPHIQALLRTPANSTESARARIMHEVRSMPSPRRLTAPIAKSRWSRRGLLSPIGGLFTTMLLVCAIVLRTGSLELFRSSAGGFETAAVVLGDSVVPARDGPARRVLDTLRIVEFVLRASSVHSATVLGSFNSWSRGATPLVAVGRDEWRARVLVPRDAVATSLKVAFLVNGTKLISAASGTAHSLVYPN